MRLSKRNFYIYIILWAAYYLQGILYESGSLLSRSILVLVMAYSGYYVFYAISHYRMPRYMRVLNLLLGLISLYGFVRLFGGAIGEGKFAVYPYSFLQLHYMSIMPIYAFYTFSKNNIIGDREIRFLGFGFLAVCVSFYFKTLIEFTTYTEQEEITNNSAYMFVSLAAIIPLLKIRDIYKYIYIGITCVFVLLSAKRGAIIIMALCTIEFLMYTLRHASRNRKLGVFMLSIILLSVGYKAAYNVILQDDYLQNRLEETLEGDTSGRDIIYNKLIKHATEDASIINILIGNGADSTFIIAGNAAHHDWLEIFTNMGLLGIVVYLLYWISFWKLYKRLRNSNEISCALHMTLTLCFLRTLFSMSINDMFVVTSFIIGYSVAYSEIIRTNIIIRNVENNNV